MKQILHVFAFTYKDGARKKAFIITTVVMLAAILILCSAPRVLMAITGGDVDSITDGVFYTCYIADETGLFAQADAALYEKLPDTHFVFASPDEVEALRATIGDEAKISLIHITSDPEGKISVTLYAKDFLNGVAAKTDVVSTVLSNVYSERIMSSAGISPDVIELSQTKLQCALVTEGGITVSGYALGMVMIMLTFFAVYYYGYGVAASVASEKSSRVMETLVVSVKPSRILVGKCLGMGVLGLTQFGGVILFALICGKLLIPEDFVFMGESLASLSAFTPSSAMLILLFFVLGYMLYAFMNAVSGASIDKIDDLNSAMMPVMIISMCAFYFSYFTVIMGTTYDYMVKLAMYIPFSAPFVMPFVLLNGEASTADILISLAILAVTITLVTVLSVRVYTRSVMHYGKRLKIKDALKNK
ncbi:MAG: ABC transporter permease [Clostridia bacterium]|nr:ABC transporter permease [Clostridia bacterium]